VTIDELRAFEVTHFDGGVMVGCLVCGVHNWKPDQSRLLTELAQSALDHRKVCP
jgi:hypothetical protein